MSAKRVFILGAGFSKQAGMPLAIELTPLIINKFKEDDLEEALSWFEWLKQRIEWLEAGGGDKASQINIEEVFDLAYFDVLGWRMKQHRCPLGRTAGDTPYNQAESIEAWLSYMEEDLINVIWDQQKATGRKLAGIRRFAENLQDSDVVLTFNYDTLLESSFSELSKPWHYGFALENGQGISVLKMHGSINWLIVPRDQAGNFGYPVLFQKEDKNRKGDERAPTRELEYDCVLLQVAHDKLGNRIENRDLQLGHKQYSVGIAGLGRYKPLDKVPGTGEIWHNAARALLTADEVCVVGFSLSPFDTMARLHFAGAMLIRSQEKRIPPKLTIVDPQADKLLHSFQVVFGPCARIDICKKKGEEVDWESFLDV
jgi:hypothetical protein